MLLKLFWHSSGNQPSSQRCGETGNQGVSGSPHLRPMGLPRNPMECRRSSLGSGHSKMRTDGAADRWGVYGWAVDVAYLSPFPEATVSRGRYGVEVRLST